MKESGVFLCVGKKAFRGSGLTVLSFILVYVMIRPSEPKSDKTNWIWVKDDSYKGSAMPYYGEAANWNK